MDHLSKTKRILVTIGLCLQSFMLMFSYALSRPSTESLFLKSQGSDHLSIAWLAVAVGSFLMVLLYNQILPKADLVKLYGQICLFCAALLAILIPCCRFWPAWAYYVLYAWKDLYVVALVEVFYTYTNTVLSIQKASWIYGFFGAIGSVGGLIGNLAVGPLAKAHGSETVLMMVIPLLGVMAIVGHIVSYIHGPVQRAATTNTTAIATDKVEKEAPGNTLLERLKSWPIIKACHIVNKSSYLWIMVILIVLVQIVMTLIDYQYNNILEKTYVDVDARTAVIGQIYAIVSATTLIFNVLTGPIIKLIGVSGTLMGIPALLMAGMATFIACPAFLVIAGVKVTSKVMDYSLFKAVRQLLYIPLNYEEKTAGKSIVDMLTFRLAKGGASVILMLITTLKLSFVDAVIVAILAGWAVAAFFIARRFKTVSTETREANP